MVIMKKQSDGSIIVKKATPSPKVEIIYKRPGKNYE